MASPELLLTFVLAAVGYAALPGPGTVYVAAQAVIRDPGSALRGALGLHVGGYFIVVASAAGLTVVFSVVPLVYEGLKLCGAVYLIWLGIRMIVSGARLEEREKAGESRNRQPATFSQGVLVEMLNPTTVVFYVAFLPQFIDPSGSAPVWAQFLVLGVAVNVIFSLGDGVAILLAVKLKAQAAGSRFGRRITAWVGGSVLVALGARLAVDRT
ncbi:MAG: LysE family translocator [Gammaproteobacteria bacterium]|nr:LysE family translocator [Gammaproteobacteria bacterium]